MTPDVIPVPAELLTTATLSVYAELYRRGAAKDGHAWVKMSLLELAHATGYSLGAISKAIAILVGKNCLLVARIPYRGGVPMFHLNPVQPSAGEKEAAQ